MGIGPTSAQVACRLKIQDMNFTKYVLDFFTIFSLIPGSATPTSLSVGSLLDDNIWHDVVISRNRRDIVFSVDRVVVQGRIKGEFSRLNLNRAVSTDYNLPI